MQIGKTSAPPAKQDNVNIQENAHVPACVCVRACVSVSAILKKKKKGCLAVGGVVVGVLPGKYTFSKNAIRYNPSCEK